MTTRLDIEPVTLEGLERRGVTCTVGEAAAVIGLSRDSAYKAAARGDLPGVRRIGGRYVVALAPLRRWLEGEGGR